MYPQKRLGERGEGKFERISWDEALDTLAGQLTRIKETYGNKGIFLATGGGYLASLHNGGFAAARLLAQFGGYVTHYGNISSEGAVWASLTQYGSVMVGNSREDMLNSKLIILWGKNPAETNIHQMTFINEAQERGAKLIVIDPRRTESSERAELLIQPRPGSDGAIALAGCLSRSP